MRPHKIFKHHVFFYPHKEFKDETTQQHTRTETHHLISHRQIRKMIQVVRRARKFFKKSKMLEYTDMEKHRQKAQVRQKQGSVYGKGAEVQLVPLQKKTY